MNDGLELSPEVGERVAQKTFALHCLVPDEPHDRELSAVVEDAPRFVHLAKLRVASLLLLLGGHATSAKLGATCAEIRGEETPGTENSPARLSVPSRRQSQRAVWKRNSAQSDGRRTMSEKASSAAPTSFSKNLRRVSNGESG